MIFPTTSYGPVSRGAAERSATAEAELHAIHSPEEAARYLRAKLGRGGDPTALAALELLLASY